jgi:general secretion pathway protein M
MTSLPPLAGRALAVAILLALLGIAYLGVVQPLLDDYASTRQSIDDTRAAIARYHRVAAELASRRTILAELSQRISANDGFLQGTNDALVAAQIQNRMKSLIESVRGELKSTQVLPVQEDGKYRRVIVRGQMALNLAAAQRVFYGIETASPLLFLDNIDMRARYNERQRERAGSEEWLLDIQFDVYGYVRSAKAPQRQSATGSSETRAAPVDFIGTGTVPKK